MASANLWAASPQVVSGLTTSDILNSAPATSRVGIEPSATIRRNVGMLIRTVKDFLNAATISRTQDIAITKIILSSVKSCWFLEIRLVMILERCAAAVSTGFVALHLVRFWHKADITRLSSKFWG